MQSQNNKTKVNQPLAYYLCVYCYMREERNAYFIAFLHTA